MELFTPLGTFFSFIGMYISLIGRNDKVKFQRYKDKGREIKEEKGQLSKAIKYYKKALNYADSDAKKADIWWLILYIQTDRQIGAVDEISIYQDDNVSWDFGPNKRPQDYKKPKQKELLK